MPPVEWHDATCIPDRCVGPVWVYFGQGVIEMGVRSDDEWRSAFNQSVTYNPDAVLAWAKVEYPDAPVRRWLAPGDNDGGVR